MAPKGDKHRGPPGKIYSYLRFSTPEQSLGDSERRQLTMAQKFAKDRHTTLDETLVDRGLSGYHGIHKKKGHLGRFLERVERGEISPGSILVIENTDRLSREPIATALDTFAGLLRNQIYIQTLSPSQLYTLEALNGGLIYQLIGQMHQAHDESAQKSKRISAARDTARKKARESGKILTARCPAWLKVRDRQFFVIPEAKATIQRIFDMKLDGFGKTRIARALNASATWSCPNGWTESYVQKILGSPAVIGIYQPYKRTDKGRVPEGEPIAEYYPPIINKNTFYAVQKQKKRRRKGSHTARSSNLFTGIVKCAYCGGTMSFSGTRVDSKNGPYLFCEKARRGAGCFDQFVLYPELEQLILECCKTLHPNEVLSNSDEQSKLDQSLLRELQGITSQLSTVALQINDLIDQVAHTSARFHIERYEDKIQELTVYEAQLQGKKEKTEQQLQRVRHDLENFKRWRERLRDLMKAFPGDAEVRLKTRQHLRELIDQIDIYPIGYREASKPGDAIMERQNVTGRNILVQTKDNTRVSLTDTACEHPLGQQCHPEEFAEFVDYFEGQRMSKQGRFYRIFFKTDIWRDLVPYGSFSSGCVFTKGTWKLHKINLSVLCTEHQKYIKRLNRPNH